MALKVFFKSGSSIVSLLRPKFSEKSLDSKLDTQTHTCCLLPPSLRIRPNPAPALEGWPLDELDRGPDIVLTASDVRKILGLK